MISLRLVVASALASILCVCALLDTASPDKILTLTHDNFAEAIESNRMVLVSFYAPWCGYCKSLLSELQKVAGDLPNMNIDGRIAIVDATLETNIELGNAEGVNGFPSIILYRHGSRHSDFLGQRTRLALLDFLKKRVGPPAIPISSIKELEEYAEVLKVNADIDVQSIIVKNRRQHQHSAPQPPPQGAGGASSSSAEEATDASQIGLRGQFNHMDNHAALVLAVFLPAALHSGQGVHSKVCKLYFSLASVYDQARFLYADNLDIISYFNIQRDSLLVFTDRSHDGIDPLIPTMLSPLSEDMEEAEIMMAVASHSVPLLVPYSIQTQPFINSIPIKKHVLVFHDNSGRSLSLLHKLEEIANEERGKLVFVTIPAVEHQLLQYFGISAAELPELIIADMSQESNMRRFAYKDFVNSNTVEPKNRLGAPSVREFLHEFQSGKLVRSLFSEGVEQVEKANKPPAGSTGSSAPAHVHIRSIVGSQFESLMGNEMENTDIFLYIFAPWCAHCKSFEPILRQLASHFHKIPGIVPFQVVKIDGSRNEIDHTEVHVRGYPTMYLFRAGDRANPIEYDAERSLERLVRFVESSRVTAAAPEAGGKSGAEVEL